MRRPPTIAEVRAAWWAERALRRVRAQLARGDLDAVEVPRPPAVPAQAGRGVQALLRRRGHSCLEGALVRQRWLASHGDEREVVIGVTSPGSGFGAHAWLQGDPDQVPGFVELRRLRP